jgi:hypothetical protein
MPGGSCHVGSHPLTVMVVVHVVVLVHHNDDGLIETLVKVQVISP